MVESVELRKISDDNVREFVKQFIINESLIISEVSESCVVADGNNYMGVVRRIRISGNKLNGKKINKSFVCKTAHKSELIREHIPVTRFFKIEVFAYNTLIPAFDKLQKDYIEDESERMKFIECFKADSKHLNELIVMQDLSDQGFKMLDRKITLDDQHLKMAVKNMANFHALSFALKKHSPEEYLECAEFVDSLPWYSEKMGSFVNLSKTRAETEMQDEVCVEKLKAYERQFSDIFSSCTDSKMATPFDVLCHGDCWVNNLLFKYENGKPVDVVLLDYQIIKRCSPIADLMHLLFTSTDEDYRRDHYEEVIDFYYESLHSRLAALNCDSSTCYPREIFQKQLEANLPFGMVIAAMFLPLQLCEKADIMDLEDAVGDIDKGGPPDMSFKDPKTKEAYNSRITGVIRDFIRLGVL